MDTNEPLGFIFAIVVVLCVFAYRAWARHLYSKELMAFIEKGGNPRDYPQPGRRNLGYVGVVIGILLTVFGAMWFFWGISYVSPHGVKAAELPQDEMYTLCMGLFLFIVGVVSTIFNIRWILKSEREARTNRIPENKPGNGE
jgi:hypothetical protein